MLSNLIPNISRHFLYSIMEHDYERGVEIINTVIKLPSEQIGEFLALFTGGLDTMFCRYEVDLRGYEKVKNVIISELKSPDEEENVEELN